MIAILTVIHVLITLAMVGVILIQRSEGGGLGIGGGSGGGMGGLMSGRGTANALTRATMVLGALFMATSIALTFAAAGGRSRTVIPPISAPASTPAQAPAAPAAPSAPVK